MVMVFLLWVVAEAEVESVVVDICDGVERLSVSGYAD